MKKEKPITVFIVKDGKGKIWREYAALDRRQLVRQVVGDWLSIFTMDDFDAHQVWRIFQKNGWVIEELQTITESSSSNPVD